jgi:hypothetical protein
MKLVHYSNRPLGEVYACEQLEFPVSKPHGLWVSVDGGGGGWRKWCLKEDWGQEYLAVATQVILVPNANILHIATSAELAAFTRRFGGALSPNLQAMGLYGIHWKAVAEQYDGVVIAPYRWKSSMFHSKLSWYWGWDCACGCIWQPRAVAEVYAVAAPSR